jgi:hypothetical protein
MISSRHRYDFAADRDGGDADVEPDADGLAAMPLRPISIAAMLDIDGAGC